MTRLQRATATTIAAFLMVAAIPLHAHENHSKADLHTKVISAQEIAGDVEISLRFSNIGSVDMYVTRILLNGETLTDRLVEVEAGESVLLDGEDRLSVPADQAGSNLFILNLDLGLDGVSNIPVIVTN